MKKILSPIATLLLLVGCAQTWYKPTARPGDFEKDRYDCLQQSQQQFSAAQTNGWQGAAVSKTVTNDGLFSSCMNARGWSLQNKQALEGQLQQQQLGMAVAQSNNQSQMNRLKAQDDATCANPDFKAYYTKTTCYAQDITFEQLADTSKITSAQKIALVKQRAAITANQKDRVAFQKSLGGKAAKVADLVSSSLMPQQEQLNLDLYNGKITWGEYNKQRKDGFTKFRERANAIQ